MSKRLDAEDTAESAVHFLQKLVAEGWGIADLHWEVDYGRSSAKGKRVPVAATVTVRLKPSLER